jgi:UDP-N-acetylmuramyl pentapeptide phosphotransferase/UDP-N-acetylglucosamine-1-phosphate transferase
LIATQGWHGRYSHDGTRGPQKFHKLPTPRIGGIAVAFGYVAAWPMLPADVAPVWALIGLAGVPALAAGLGEDLTRRVGVRQRLLATMAAGVIFALSTGYVMDKVDLPGIDWVLSFYVVALLFTGFAMGGVANAINIIDGFNGLAAGALIIMFGAFAWVAHQVGDTLVLSLALVYAALVAGFFAVNFPHGKIFLGDGGAYFCGFLLASLGVLLPSRNVEVSAWTAILICAYPVIETLASMRRKSRRDGHSVGQPDRVHFHMLAHRRYARRMVRRGGRVDLRNPATAVVTWSLPLATTAFVMIGYDSVFLCALFFFATVWLYALFYRVMSLNPPRLPTALARLL